MAEQDKPNVVVVFGPTAKRPIREPFIPMTGNPENGNYTDWSDDLREGEKIDFPSTKPPLK